MRDLNSHYRIFQSLALRPIWLLLPVVLSAAALSACDSGTPRHPAAEGAFPLPALAATPALGERRAEFGDRTLLINFWATWCTPCRDEMPDLQALSDSLDRDRFAVIGVSIDDDRNLVQEFLLDYGISFANYHDRDQSLASERLGILVLPVTYIVAPDGRILARISGARRWDRDSLMELLDAPESAGSARGVAALESGQRS